MSEQSIQSSIKTGHYGMKRLSFIFIVYGSAVLVVQVVFIRELLSIFGGNELAIGLILGSWLFWTAMGSFISGRMRLTERSTELLIVILALIFVFLIPLTVLCARMSRYILGIAPGEIIGIIPMALLAMALISPFCFGSGALFPILSVIYQQHTRSMPGRAVGFVYAMEGIGAMIGGLVMTFLLFKVLSNMQIAMCGCVLFLILLMRVIKTRAGVRWLPSIRIACLIVSLGFIFVLSEYVERWSNYFRWRGYNVVESHNSIYGNITVTELEGQVNFFSNGLLLFSSEDPLSAEESVHFALLQHPEPRSVLLIGGGLNGGIREVLKHSAVRRIDVVELDASIIDLGLKYLPPEEAPPDNPELIHYHFIDPRYYLQTTSTMYDVIVFNMPDPSNALVNRLYTRECFQEVSSILSPEGVVSFSVTSSENFLNDELAAFLAGMKATLEVVFPTCVIFPGNTALFFASHSPEYITENPDTLAQRLKERAVETLYVHPAFFSFRLSEHRLNNFTTRLAETTHVRINTDLNPVGFYYAITLWSTYFSRTFRNVLLWLEKIPYKSVCFGLFLLCSALPVVIVRRKRTVLFATYVVGLSMIGLEMIVLLSYQSFYGYIYEHVAVLIACFMGGLAVGALIGLRIKKTDNRVITYFAGVQFLAVLLPILMVGFFFVMLNAEPAIRAALARLGFPSILLLAGIIGGLHFQLANRLYLAEESAGNRGAVYAVDLLGAAVGASLISVFFIPLLGMMITCAELTFLNIIALAGIIFGMKR